MLEKFRNFMIESANIMFDDTKNDLRSLPKSVRLQILIVLSPDAVTKSPVYDTQIDSI